jgi:serine protease Do
MLKRNKILILTAILALLAVFAAAGSGAAASPPADLYTDNPIVKIVKECSPAVVNIDTETMVTRRPHPFASDPFFREFFGREFDSYRRMVPMKGKGSGFIVDGREGYIMTNNHVVEGADKITATLLDGRTFDAELVGRDPTFDLAVIRIKADNLPSLKLGDSDAAEVGEWVVAIGNPHGFENTVTAGIISAKNRTLQASDVNFQGFMQTDAAINPGNSGGPLIDTKGEVVGINTAIVPYAQGIGFAVPVNMAKQIMSDLIEHGEVKRGWMGVVLQNVTPGFAETYDLPVESGAVISDVMPGSPSEAAGLARGDVITSIDGREMKKSQDVVLYIRSRLEGDDVSIDVYRDSKKQTIKVTLGPIPGADDSDRPSRRRGGDGGESGRSESTRVGATVRAITPELKKDYDLDTDRGLVVIEVEAGSIADGMGIREGDVIVEVNRRAISGISDWDRALRGDARTIVMFVRREGQTLFFTYKK